MRWAPLLFVLLIVPTFFSLFLWLWPLEAFASYIPQIYILVFVLLLVYATFATWFLFVYGRIHLVEQVGKYRLLTLALTLVLGLTVAVHSLRIVPAQDIAEKLTFQGDYMSVGTFNKLYTSNNFVDDANIITASRVDVFALQEVREADINYITDQVNHPYSFMTDCNCSAGDTEVAVISRYPITNALTIYEDDNAAIIRSVISPQDQTEFIFYAIHMHVPYQYEAYQKREEAFRTLTKALASEEKPIVVAGDFNSTIYSPDMQSFMRDNQSIVQNVVTRAWPRCSWFGFGEALCTRIDFTFIPVGATAHAHEIGQQEFSDHRSVITEFSF